MESSIGGRLHLAAAVVSPPPTTPTTPPNPTLPLTTTPGGLTYSSSTPSGYRALICSRWRTENLRPVARSTAARAQFWWLFPLPAPLPELPSKVRRCPPRPRTRAAAEWRAAKAAASAAWGSGRPETRAAARAVAVVVAEGGGGRRGEAAAAREGALRGRAFAAAVAALAAAEEGGGGGAPAAAAAEPERVMTVDDCRRGRFLGVRIPPEAAPPPLLLVVLAGVEAVMAAFVEVIIAPRPRAGVNFGAFAATADFCLGVASFWPPESRAERLVVRPGAAFSALGSAFVAVEAVKVGEKIGEIVSGVIVLLFRFRHPPSSSFSARSIFPFLPFFFLDDGVIASPAMARFRACCCFGLRGGLRGQSWRLHFFP